MGYWRSVGYSRIHSSRRAWWGQTAFPPPIVHVVGLQPTASSLASRKPLACAAPKPAVIVFSYGEKIRGGVFEWTKTITPATNVGDVVVLDAITHRLARTIRSARTFQPPKPRRRRSVNRNRLRTLQRFRDGSTFTLRRRTKAFAGCRNSTRPGVLCPTSLEAQLSAAKSLPFAWAKCGRRSQL